MLSDINSKELSIVELFSEGWKLFIKNFQTILAITLIVYIPLNIIIELIPVNETSSLLTFWRIVNVLEGFIGIIAKLAIIHLIHMDVGGKTVTVGDALKKALSKWWPVFYTSIIYNILTLLLTLLLIIPGILYSNYWYFFIFAIVIFDKTGQDALDYSKKIVEGRWWKVFGYTIGIGVVKLVIIVPLLRITFVLPENFFLGIITSSLFEIIYSYITVVTIVFFLNFDKTKKEVEVKADIQL